VKPFKLFHLNKIQPIFMPQNRIPQQGIPQPADNLSPSSAGEWNEFLTPGQRSAAIADILATIALRILKDKNETDQAS
jgi:hypothetical protein